MDFGNLLLDGGKTNSSNLLILLSIDDLEASNQRMLVIPAMKQMAMCMKCRYEKPNSSRMKGTYNTAARKTSFSSSDQPQSRIVCAHGLRDRLDADPA